MTLDQLLQRALAMPHAYADTPFGPEPICARIGKRIFAEVFPSRGWVTFKCEPQDGLMWRAAYPDHVRRGYHCPPPQHPYSNTVTLDGAVPDDVLTLMLEQSYARALRTMTKKERAEALHSDT